MTSPREILWLERAAELAEAANQALRASHECLREAEQARLTAERERPLADDAMEEGNSSPDRFGRSAVRQAPDYEPDGWDPSSVAPLRAPLRAVSS